MNEAALRDWIERSCGFTNARPGPLLTGGNSNLTFLVETDQGRMVLRRPPVDTVSDRAAAGIAREFAALQALHGRARVPEPIGWCDDQAIVGTPFSIVRWVEGASLTDRWPDGGTDADINRLGQDLVTALAEVHRIDPVGLVPDRFGRPDGFVMRQVDRWTAIRDREAVRDLPLLNPIADWLRANAPEPERTSIIHCDFHLDNCLSDVGGARIKAIIDWEMAALGDPRIDLGLVLFFWKRDPTRPLGLPSIQGLSNQPGTAERAELADVWSAASGLAASHLDYFMVFAAWRLAAIIEGAFVLYRQGRVDSTYARHLESDVPRLLSEAAAIIDPGER